MMIASNLIILTGKNNLLNLLNTPTIFVLAWDNSHDSWASSQKLPKMYITWFFYNKPGFENLGFTHMHIHNIVFDIHIFSMNRCKWMKKSQLQQKIGPAKAKGKCNNWLLQANVTSEFYTKLLLDLRMYSGI